MTTVRVHLQTVDGPVAVGTARFDRLRGTTTTQFSYDDGYLAGPGWAISPDLPVLAGRPTTEGLPGALDDSAPDAWGRNLIARRLAARARDQGFDAPSPTDIDYLLGVNDLSRQGALRLTIGDDDSFLADGVAVPPLLQLGTLLEATRRVVESSGGVDDAVRTLLDAGSGSLGGARPKASVTDGERLFVAKFPHPDDQWDVMRWEVVALDLAERCGLTAPPRDALTIDDATVLLVERFDRHGEERVPFLSARSLIGARDDAGRDYLELVEAISEHGSAVRADLEELWKRIAFSIVLNNTDDHMRNHAVLRRRNGWTLSPIFDVNPDPRPAAERSTGIGGAVVATDSRQALFATADRFGLTASQAERHWRTIVDGISDWRGAAVARGAPDHEVERFAPVLDRWA